MVIIIDAYNVLKQNKDDNFITEHEQAAFITTLYQYAKKKDHSLIVVFDGGQSAWPWEQKKGLVTIIYSGSKLSADEIIKKLLKKVHPTNSALVTTDRDLRNYAHGYTVPTISSSHFNRLLHADTSEQIIKVIKSSDKAKKQESAVHNPELDELMHKASKVIVYKDEDLQEDTSRKRPSHTVSKREKKLERVVKKL